MMKLPSQSELLFSVKSFAASMLALYIALSIGLPRPFWAMLTVYVVSNPLTGAVRSKAVFRVCGTILGSAATVLLVPRLANAPALLSLALALWVAVCLYISLLDRTPRSYLFMLSGYTAALIGFPVVTDPAAAFDVALARVEEITLGIVCATAVHSLLFPQGLGPVFLSRLHHAIDEGQRWMHDALEGDTGFQGQRDRRKLAAAITELRLMAVLLPFDTSHLRWTSNAIRALQDKLSAMVPLLSAVEDRLRTLHAADEAEPGPRWRALLSDIADWSGQPMSNGAQERANVDGLHSAIDAAAPSFGGPMSWSEVLKVSLAARLHALVDAWMECRALRQQLDAGFRGDVRPAMRRAPGLSPHVLREERGLALLSAFAAAIAISSCCAFWIVSGWPSGSAAATYAAVFCCFFATQDDPVPGIMVFLKCTIWSIPLSALYLLVILPAIHNFETLVLATAPVLLVLGILVARPQTSGRSLAFVFGFVGTLSLQDTGSADFVSYINLILAQLSGIAAAALFTRLLRTVSAGWTARRLLHVGWAELAALGKATRPPSMVETSARMLDRVGLLTPRLAMAGPQEDLVAVNVLGDLRVGLNMSQLVARQSDRQPQRLKLALLMQALSAHFGNRRKQTTSADPGLLVRLDDALEEACALGERDTVAALVGIRRDLLPVARPYAPVTDQTLREVA